MTRPRIVIIGGGNGGLLAAHRLADHADVTILEAGVDPGDPVPYEFLHEHAFPEHDWEYTNEDSGHHLVRGRVLGGGSSVNAAAGSRGQPAGFEAWGEGWRWDDLQPAMRALETDEQFGAEPYHGDEGPIRITRLEPGPLDLSFYEASRVLGYEECPDHNAPGTQGYGPWPTNRVDGGRWGALAAIAPLVRDRVTLRPSTVVDRIVIEDGRAVGVEVDGGEEIIPADLVILSAGAYGSPEVLWRSGIDAPQIGEGLQDHPWVMMNVLARDEDDVMARPVSGSLLRAGVADDPSDEFQVFPFSTWLYDRSAPRNSYSVSVALMQPESRGRVFQGADGGTRISLAHLKEQTDLDRMAVAVSRTAELIDAMAETGIVTVPDDAWWKQGDLKESLRERVETYNHPVASCGIGRTVDRRLNVIGVEGVKVIDASVMPRIPDGGPNLVTMAIGWIGGGIVLEDLGL
ncbi:GMC family oxidoreductase N-terminal domain-containing protein [Demequina capsici]|uniref:GMC family oxidoreductase N-terminal domain-containing protein n=1 Tax=Demequina capsici TaxID=3075620 RepID=A0AA96FBX0_9MICO|nr:GMC family oxidoreductase N-terminal domain-containing protein [Demequina sp. PMTSA13]WNM26899.1 GMC family oxidoreductase N-terminal domain-containing protein [Demequina sp. PMTSA13]